MRVEQSRVQLLAPVGVPHPEADAVGDSLRILSAVYHYNQWIYALIREEIGSRVVEVGAGIGNITRFLLHADELVCLEPFDAYRTYLAEAYSKHLNVRVLAQRIQDCPNPDVPERHFDSVVCLNVLEHIEDDGAALRCCAALLRPGGRAIVLVPAFQSIFGEMDRAMGHYRRYSKTGLTAVFRAAGLRVRRARYMNATGVLAWWWEGRVRKSRCFSARKAMLFDRLVPFLSAVESIVSPWMGQSLIVVGDKAK